MGALARHGIHLDNDIFELEFVPNTVGVLIQRGVTSRRRKKQQRRSRKHDDGAGGMALSRRNRGIMHPAAL